MSRSGGSPAQPRRPPLDDPGHGLPLLSASRAIRPGPRPRPSGAAGRPRPNPPGDERRLFLGGLPPRLPELGRGSGLAWLRAARRTYRILGIHDRLLNLDRVARVYV